MIPLSIRAIALLTVLSSVLAGCTPTLDADQIGATIQKDLEQQGGLSLKAVVCPSKVAIATGQSFNCIGELDPEGAFTINVTQQDERGNVKWEVPNSKGLLNLSTLETYFKDEIGKEIGKQPTFDCGGTYRINKPGDSFECRVMNAIAIPQSQSQTLLVKVLVKTDPDGNVNWQQIRQQPVVVNPKPSTPTSNRSTTPAPAALSSTGSPASTAPAATDSPPAQNADEFLNRPGATDGFD